MAEEIPGGVDRRAEPPKKSFLGMIPDFTMAEAIVVGLILMVPLLLISGCYLSRQPEPVAQETSVIIMDTLKYVLGAITVWGGQFVSAMSKNIEKGE